MNARFAKLMPMLGLLIFVLLLNLHPRSDGPTHFHDSAGFHFDPYSKVHTARNLVLFGETAREYDHWTPYVHGPVYHTLQWIIFSLFGPGFWQIKLLTIFASALTAAVLFNLLRREYGLGAAWAGGLFFATSEVVFFSARSGLIEPVMTSISALMLLFVYRLYKHPAATWKTALIMGMLGGLTLATKWNGAYMVVAMLVYIVMQRPGVKRCIPAVLGGLILSLVITEGYLLLQVQEDVARESRMWAHKAANPDYLKNFLANPLFLKLQRQDAILFLAVASFSFVIRRKAFKGEEQKPVSIILGLAFLLGTCWLGVSTHRPFRYHIPLMFPACYFAAAGLHRWYLSWSNPDRQHVRMSGLQTAVLFLSLAFLLDFGVLSHARDLGLPRYDFVKRIIFSILAAVPLVFSIQLLRRKAPLFLSHRWRYAAWLVPGVFLAFHLVLNLPPLMHWVKKPIFTMYDFSRFAGDRWENATIAGITPNFSLMENRHYGLRWEQSGVNLDALKKGLWTHLVIPTDWGMPKMFTETLIPDLMKEAVFLGRYPMVHRWSHFYYARSLKPLEYIQGSGGQVNVLNPDPHTAQFLYGISWNDNTAQVTGLECRDIRPTNSITLAESAGETERGSLFEFAAWQSIRVAGYKVADASVAFSPYGTHHHCVTFDRSGLSVRRNSSVTFRVGKDGRISVYMMYLKGDPGAVDGLKGYVKRGEEWVELETAVSEVTPQGLFTAAWSVEGMQNIKVAYKGKAACSILGWIESPLEELPTLGKMSVGHVKDDTAVGR